MRFFAVSQLGPKRRVTPEGFIVCLDVPIARTGQMLYGPDEVPVEAGRDGVVRIDRIPEEVFRDETVASFEGKPVTIDHPSDFVTPDNWRELAVGVTQNVRRGTGIEDDLLLADLLITDARAIALVGDTPPEVSCGYEADYEQTEPGRGVQRNIIGNHVALVENGRCGPRCAIGDEENIMATKQQQKTKRSWKDRIMTAFKARDEEALNEAMDEAEGEIVGGGGEQQKLVIEVKAAGQGQADEAEGQQQAETEKKEGDEADPIAALTAKVDALTAAVAKLVGAEQAEATCDEEQEKTGDEAEGKEKEKAEDADEEKKEDATKTGDSLRISLQDVMARAEILAPGAVKAPTLDAKDPKKSRDALCGCKRKALDAALTGAHAAAIKPLLAGKAIDKMTCQAVDTAFVAASEVVKAINNAGAIRPGVTTKDFGRAVTPADINKRNAEFYGQRAGSK